MVLRQGVVILRHTSPNRPWHVVPSVYLLDALVQIERRGFDPEAVLGPFGLERSALAEPGRHIPRDQHDALIEHIVVDLNVPEIGFVLPESVHLLNSGIAGAAALTAPTVGDSIRATIDYQDLLAVPVVTEMDVTGSAAMLCFWGGGWWACRNAGLAAKMGGRNLRVVFCRRVARG